MEERKLKVGGQDKLEAGVANMKSSAIRLASVLEESPELLNLKVFDEVLRFDRNLLEKIQLKEQKLKEEREKEVTEVD